MLAAEETDATPAGTSRPSKGLISQYESRGRVKHTKMMVIKVGREVYRFGFSNAKFASRGAGARRDSLIYPRGRHQFTRMRADDRCQRRGRHQGDESTVRAPTASAEQNLGPMSPMRSIGHLSSLDSPVIRLPERSGRWLLIISARRAGRHRMQRASASDGTSS